MSNDITGVDPSPNGYSDVKSQIASKLPPVPSYPAPLPPTRVTEIEEDVSDDELEETEGDDYETHVHDAQMSLQSDILGERRKRVYAYESQLQEPPPPLIVPGENLEDGFDPFKTASDSPNSNRSSLDNLGNIKGADLSEVTDWTRAAILQNYFKSKLTRIWFEKRKLMVWHRNLVAQEILTTEQNYVQNLKILIGLYMHPLQAELNTPSPTITKEQYDTLFPKLDIILALNTELLGSIHARVHMWSNHQLLGDVFVRISSFFKMYTEYCSKYEAAGEMYRSLMKVNPKFVKFLSIPEKLNDVHGLDLLSFLIMPCQRIPRYLMLLQELNKWTWQDHPDKQQLERAVAVWSEIVSHVNDSMAEAGRMNELLRIEKKFNNSLNLCVATRKYVKQGPIHKITSRMVVTPTYFLFTDILVYGYLNNDDSVKHKGTLQLNTAWVRNLEDNPNISNGFQLITPGKAYTFYLDTPKEKKSWVDALQMCIDDLVRIDPTLVTRRATQVKRNIRFGQQIWNLFTKDVSSFEPVDQDDLIKEHVSSMNRSLAQGLEKRKMIPVRTSLENEWEEIEDEKSKQKKNKKDKNKDKNHEKASSSSSNPEILQPQIIPQPNSPIKSVKADPLPIDSTSQLNKNQKSQTKDQRVPLDDSLLKDPKSSGQKYKPTKRGDLLGKDKQYSPLIPDSRRTYGTQIIENGNHQQDKSCCSSCCTIL